MIRISFTPEESDRLQYERHQQSHPLVQKKMEVLYLKSLYSVQRNPSGLINEVFGVPIICETSGELMPKVIKFNLVASS